jgi:hypothetical protein
LERTQQQRINFALQMHRFDPLSSSTYTAHALNPAALRECGNVGTSLR